MRRRGYGRISSLALSALTIVGACGGGSGHPGQGAAGAGGRGGASGSAAGGAAGNGSGGTSGSGAAGATGSGAAGIGGGGTAAGAGAGAGAGGASGTGGGTSGSAGGGTSGSSGRGGAAGTTAGNGAGGTAGGGRGGSAGTGAGGRGGSAGTTGTAGTSADAGTTDGGVVTNVPGTWYELGGSATGGGISTGVSGDYPSLVFDRDGHPLISWTRQTQNTTSVAITHWDGAAWSQLGAHSLDDKLGVFNRAALAMSGAVPFVTWDRGTIQLLRWTGRAWGPLGTTGDAAISSTNGYTPNIAIDSSGRPTVAWQYRASQSATVGAIYVRRWNGSAYEELAGSASGGGLSGTGSVGSATVVVDGQGNPIVVWKSFQGSVVSLIAKRWTGTAWESLGDTVTPSEAGFGPALALDATGQPVVAWSRGTVPTGNPIYVRRWNGAAWADLGGAPTGASISQNSQYTNVVLAVDGQGGISVAWSDQRDVFLQRWNGSEWQQLGGSATGGGISQTPSTAPGRPALAALGNRICAAWTESESNVQLRCFDLSPAFCGCDATAACDAGCACDADCLGPNWDDFRCEGGAGFRCASGQCVAANAACNGTAQCGDGSDESPLCPGGALADVPRAVCADDQWACASGQCVFREERCDGITGCGDGSDEDAVCNLRSTATAEPVDATWELTGLWAGPSGAWAAGASGVVVGRTATGDWARQAVNVGEFTLGAVWGTGNARLYISYAGSLLGWDGANWGAIGVAANYSHESIWGLGAADIWLAGYEYSGSTGKIVRASTYHYTGTTWDLVDPAAVTTALRAVRGTATGDVWAVGDAGIILHWNGSAWSPVTSNTTANLQGVWAAAVNDAWAVGDAGVMLRWTGGPAWTAVTPVTGSGLRDVWGSAANDVWAVGGAGTVLHWNGSRWSSVWSGTSMLLHAVYGYAGNVWASGDKATILRLSP